MSEGAFIKLLRVFDIVPSKLSVKEAGMLYGVTITARSALNSSKSSAVKLDYENFMKAIGRCAVQAFFDDSTVSKDIFARLE